MQEYNLVGDVAGEAHVVGDQQHGPIFFGQRFDHPQHFALKLGVERRGRLVEQQRGRVHGQRTGDGRALLLAAGELTGVGVGLVGDADAIEGFHGALARLGPVALEHPTLGQHDVLDNGKVRPEVKLLEYHRQVGADPVHLTCA